MRIKNKKDLMKLGFVMVILGIVLLIMGVVL